MAAKSLLEAIKNAKIKQTIILEVPTGKAAPDLNSCIMAIGQASKKIEDRLVIQVRHFVSREILEAVNRFLKEGHDREINELVDRVLMELFHEMFKNDPDFPKNKAG